MQASDWRVLSVKNNTIFRVGDSNLKVILEIREILARQPCEAKSDERREHKNKKPEASRPQTDTTLPPNIQTRKL